MTTTITHAGGTITPHAVEGYRSARRANTLIREVLDRSNPDADLRAFGMRTGSFRLVFESTAAAIAAEAALAVEQVLTITNTDVAVLNMTFVCADGDLRLEQDDDVADVWRIDVPFYEVAL